MVRTVDSDIVILSIHSFTSFGLTEFWICLSSGKKTRNTPIHTLSAQLGPSRCSALPLFYAVSSCGTVSQFLGCGKKTAWQNTPEITEVLVALTSDLHVLSLESQLMHKLERFVVVMYSKSCVDWKESMKQGINCSPEGRRNCHQRKQLFINRSSEHYCRPDSSGGKRPQTPLISKTGAGRRPALVNGCHSGQLLRTAAKPPSYSVVAVKSLA